MRDKERKSISEKVSERLEVSGYVGAGAFRITVTGSHSVHIENHRGILEYEQDSIKVNCGRTIVSVTGGGLEVKAINGRELLIGGAVASIGLER